MHLPHDKRDDSMATARDADKNVSTTSKPASLRALVALGPLPNFAARRAAPANTVTPRSGPLELVVDRNHEASQGDAERTTQWEPPTEAGLDAEATQTWMPEPEPKPEPEPALDAERTLQWEPPSDLVPEPAPPKRWRPLADALEPTAGEIEPDESDADSVIDEVPRRRGWIAVAAAAAVVLLAGAHATRAQQGEAQTASASLVADAPEPDRSATEPHEPQPVEDGEADAIVIVEEADKAEPASAGKRRATTDRRRRAKRRRNRRVEDPTDVLVQTAKRDLEQGRRGAAIRALERALDLQPRSAAAHAALSTAYFDRGDFELAVSHGEEAVKSAFDEPNHHLLLGDAYFRTGRSDDAAHQWEIAAEHGSTRAASRLAKLDD